MPAMIDPSRALNSMQKILLRGHPVLSFLPCELNPGFVAHRDGPTGSPRITIAKIDGRFVKALCIFHPVEPYEGLWCFAIGYAVAPQHRKQGLGKTIVRVGIEELSNGLKRANHIDRLWIEAVISTHNVASQRVAEGVINATGEDGVDAQSGSPAKIYRRLVEAA